MPKPHALLTVAISFGLLLSIGSLLSVDQTKALALEDTIIAYPLFQLATPLASTPTGFSPQQIRAAYNLPSTGGDGSTIAIVTAYDAPTIEDDLNVFSLQFGLPTANAENFEIHKMASNIATDRNWSIETSLDVEWSHAIAPSAKILLVEAKSPRITDLLAAVDYARNRPDVIAVSMSWGSREFSTQEANNYHFISAYNASFFAASGDNGAGVCWPSTSARVIAVGGTTLNLNVDGTVSSETSWAGSGGGVSAYEPRPEYQIAYNTAKPGSIVTARRAVPDISYNANPTTGVSIYTSTTGWSKIGGTSAGAPQWAAIQALGLSAANDNFYKQAASPDYSDYFRDITEGSNGNDATVGYDYVTGLGSPLTISYGQLAHPATINTSITLLPAEQASQLTSVDQFEATYSLNGEQLTAYLQTGVSALNTDLGSKIVISGTSTASTKQERWAFNSNADPVAVPAGSNSTLYYYHSFAQSTNYLIEGGGDPQTPIITYYNAPLRASDQVTQQINCINLSRLPQIIWMLQGTTASTNSTVGANVSERWITTTSTWVITGANQLPPLITYRHQYFLTTNFTQTNSQWYDNGETAQIAVPGISNRILGTGLRVVSYSIDGSDAIQIQPTTGTAQIQILMDKAHILNINTINQYQLTLDPGAIKQLASVTAPTINGDSYWYDKGTAVKVTLNGITGRFSGAGDRLTTYTADNVITQVSTLNSIEVLNAIMLTPQAISATTVKQYKLSTPSRAVNAITAPSITGDTDWYDEGTSVTVEYDCSWNSTGQSRSNAVSYMINQAGVAVLTRAANGTFPVRVTLNEPKNITVSAVTQYSLNIHDGQHTTLSLASPTGDNFFDAGTTLTITTPNLWGTYNGDTRQILASYTLDGITTMTKRAEEENFDVVITFDRAHELTFNPITQYLATFQFKDQNGNTILPTSLQIQTENSTLTTAPFSDVWVDSGTRFHIECIIWESLDVKPAQQVDYLADTPLNETISCRVYDIKLAVKDYLNLPLSGAQLEVTLANQTTLQTHTASDGTTTIRMVPLGTFDATISYLGMSTSITGDAAIQGTVTCRLFVSFSILGVVMGMAIVVIISALFFRRRLSIAPKVV